MHAKNIISTYFFQPAKHIGGCPYVTDYGCMFACHGIRPRQPHTYRAAAVKLQSVKKFKHWKKRFDLHKSYMEGKVKCLK